VTRSLLLAGGALILVGLLIVAGMLSRPQQEELAPMVGEEQSQLFTPPSRVMMVVGTLSLAAGFGCIGLGMNRWRQANRRAAR
jgi:hypothetical protein